MSDASQNAEEISQQGLEVALILMSTADVQERSDRIVTVLGNASAAELLLIHRDAAKFLAEAFITLNRGVLTREQVDLIRENHRIKQLETEFNQEEK